MSGRRPGSDPPARRRLLSAPPLPASRPDSGQLGQAEETPADTAQPGAGLRTGWRGYGRGAGFAMAPPSLLFPRLPEGAGQAPAPAGASLKRAPGLEVGLVDWPRAQPRRATGPASAPSPGFCEVGLTWQSLRGGQYARPPVTGLPPPGP